MVYVLTGEDVSSSRTRLLSLADKKSQVLHFDARKNSISDILDSFEANSLFSEKKTIIVEYFTRLKSEKVFEKIKTFIKDVNAHVFLWDEADLSQKLVKELSGAKIESFVFPKVFYEFIDGISPKKREQSVRTLSLLLKTFAPEQVLHSLGKRIRLLCLVKKGVHGEFSESSRLAPWQITKLTKQAGEWKESELSSFLMKLAETDEHMKSGGLTLSLTDHLDIMLLSDLN